MSKLPISQDSTKLQNSSETRSDFSVIAASESFRKLIEIVAALRGPGGCPWDLEQSQKSLVQFAIEEAYELAEAIETGNQANVSEELGDFLFQVLLQSQVAQDQGLFSIQQVIEGLNQKMVYRHPHVFANSSQSSIEEVWKNWEKLKAAEKGENPDLIKPPFNYPQKMPALQAAHKIGIKTEGYKFDWPNAKAVFEKVREEFAELEQALEQGDIHKISHELGDLLFSSAQLARHLKIEAEQSLRDANRRFARRFTLVLKNSGLTKEQFANLSTVQMEALWQQAKLENAAHE